MKTNMGSTDRIVRAVIAIVLLALALTSTITGVVGTIAFVLGVILLLTAVVGICPLYLPFKISTKRV